MTNAKFLFATNNPGKVKEIRAIFSQGSYSVVSLAELGLSFEPTETGDTFLENATQKATKVLEFLKAHGYDDIAVLADDSGLCIDALGGEPGVDSANYMGRETPYKIRNAHIIKLLEGVQGRAAKFVCVIACVYPNGQVVTTTGEMCGEIAHEILGDSGFGYDPIFYLPSYNKTSAQLTMEEKNKISHRGKALAAMIEVIS